MAKDQAKTVTNRERARLYVETPPDDFAATVERFSEFVTSFPISVSNIGHTPAVNVRATYTGVVSKRETSPEDGKRTVLELPTAIAASEKVAAHVNIMGGDFRTREGLALVPGPKHLYIHLWGRIEYQNVLTGETHSTKFKYFVQIARNRGSHCEPSSYLIGRWRKPVDPEDNQAT